MGFYRNEQNRAGPCLDGGSRFAATDRKQINKHYSVHNSSAIILISARISKQKTRYLKTESIFIVPLALKPDPQ